MLILHTIETTVNKQIQTYKGLSKCLVKQFLANGLW